MIFKKVLLLLLLIVFSGLFFLTCEKPVQFEPPPPYGKISFSANELLVDIKINDHVVQNQLAYHFKVNDMQGRTPSSSAPVIFNVYKSYENGPKNLICKIFGGGVGFSINAKAYYCNNDGIVDTLVNNPNFDTVIVIGNADKNKYSFEIAVQIAMDGGPAMLSGGYETGFVSDGIVRGGGLSRFLDINSGAINTADNHVKVSARFSVAGITDSLSYIKYSTQVPMFFSTVLEMDSILKKRKQGDTQYVNINSNLRLRLMDSVVVNNDGISVGKFGGLVKISPDSFGLSKFFSFVKSEPSSNIPGDTGWFTVQKIDVLPDGAGGKSISLYHPSWSNPLIKNIQIMPYTLEVTLDKGQANILTKGKDVCLLGDDIPFLINTFGDTTFDSEVWVWIATRNYSAKFIDATGQFTGPFLEQKDTPFGLGIGLKWHDAILETPPEKFNFTSNGNVSGVLNHDKSPDYYEKKYRVSPLGLLNPNTVQSNLITDYERRVGDKGDLRRSNNVFLSQLMLKGSILGYPESNIGDFESQSYIKNFNIDDGNIHSYPFVGWFEVEPLEEVTTDSAIDPAKLFSKYDDKFGLKDGMDLYPSQDRILSGRSYYSVYSAFIFTPNIIKGDSMIYYKTEKRGIKLYKNPMRSIPGFVSANMSGTKEFVICVYARGKYFKEPRCMISTFSTDEKYVWDKIPPHFAWDSSSSPLASHYSPMYYMREGEGKVSDLGTTVIPYVFDVSLSQLNAKENKDCSLRDFGFGRITSVKLCFNYSNDLKSIDPLTGFRKYERNSIKIDLPSSYIEGQSNQAISNIVFSNIDARQWQGGLWDMWLETEDNLQNKGAAPLFVRDGSYAPQNGLVSVRQIKIR